MPYPTAARRSCISKLAFSLTALIALDAGAALAVTAVQTGNWDDPATWGGAVPSTTATVSIPSGITVTIPAGLTVSRSGGAADIDGLGTLVLDGTLDLAGSSSAGITSFLNLSTFNVTVGTTGVLNVNFASNFYVYTDATIAGTVNVVGPTATIQLNSASSSMTIQGTGVVNNYRVFQVAAGSLVNAGAINNFCGALFALSGATFSGNPVQDRCLRVTINQAGSQPDPTTTSPVRFLAVFDKPATGFATGDVTVGGSANPTTGTVTEIAPMDGTTYEVAVSGMTLDGTVTAVIPAGVAVSVAAGDPNQAGTSSDNSVTYDDVTPPVLTAIERLTPAAADTNADALVFRIRFDDDVVSLDATDLVVTGTTATITNIATSTADRVFDITVSGGDLADLNGTVGLDVAPGRDVQDAAGNVIAATEPATDEVYLVDNSGPVLLSFARQSPMTQLTNADTLIFRASFDSAAVNVDASDFVVSGSTASVTALSVVTTDTVFDLTVSGGDLASFNGIVGLDLGGGQNIADALGNPVAAGEPATDETYTVDNTSPLVTVDSLLTFDSTPPLSGTVDDVSALLELTVDGQTVSPVNVGDGTWTLADGLLAPLANGLYDVAVTASDVAGNVGSDTTSNELEINPDTDGDGVDDVVELGAPNNGDGNADGMPDAGQPQVASLPTATGRGYMTLEVSGACAELRQVAAVDPASLPRDPFSNASYPFGLVEFVLPCETATVEVTFHGADPASFIGSAYRKYGPVTPGDVGSTSWYDFSTFAVVEGVTWTLDLADDRLGDDTGDDGVIVDPGGPTAAQLTAVPVDQPWALLLLALAILGVGARVLGGVSTGR